MQGQSQAFFAEFEGEFTLPLRDGTSPLLLTNAVAETPGDLRVRQGGRDFCLCKLRAGQNCQFQGVMLPPKTTLKTSCKMTIAGFYESQHESDCAFVAPGGVKTSPAAKPQASPAGKPIASPAAKPSASLGAQMASKVEQVKRTQGDGGAPAAKKQKEEPKPVPKPTPQPPSRPGTVDMDAKPAPKQDKTVTLESGVKYQILKPGNPGAPEAKSGKTVVVQYDGRLTNGKRFDKGKIDFKLGKGQVIAGWDQGVKGMKVGEHRKLFIPPKHAYGRQGAPPDIPPNAALVFDVTLLRC